MSGSNATNQNGVYGTKGVASSSNAPGARQLAVSWTDNSGNLWLFGGYGYPASGGIGMGVLVGTTQRSISGWSATMADIRLLSTMGSMMARTIERSVEV